MMRPRAGLLVCVVCLGNAGAVAAQEPPAEPKNEIVVFGGVSVLDASRGGDRTITLPAFPGRLRDRFPGIPPLRLDTETSLGGSSLFGFRYSRYVKGRLAAEADFAVAPTHDLEVGGEVCFQETCFGRGEVDRGRALSSRNLTAWHYGGGLAYDLTGGDVRPVVIFGAGGVSYSGAGQGSTDFVLRFGAGLKVLFGRVGGRIDVVDHLVPDHFFTGKAEHDLHATAGFLVRF